mgnify:CR=1 FL=1
MSQTKPPTGPLGQIFALLAGAIALRPVGGIGRALAAGATQAKRIQSKDASQATSLSPPLM